MCRVSHACSSIVRYEYIASANMTPVLREAMIFGLHHVKHNEIVRTFFEAMYKTIVCSGYLFVIHHTILYYIVLYHTILYYTTLYQYIL